MSFGFSIGDFVATIELANKIRREFVGAPSQFKDISDELRSLSIVLQDLDIFASVSELENAQEKHLIQIIGNCRNLLCNLEKKLDNYTELGVCSRGNLGRRIKRVWKKLKWEPEDIRELRDRLTSNVVLLNSFLGGIASQTALATKKGVDRLNEQQDDHERLTILDWLTPLDYAPQQNDLINRRQAGTGNWLLMSTEFQTWLKSDNSQTLFCPGIPGAGKSIFTSIVTDELMTRFRNNKGVGIAYIYCSFWQQEKQKSVYLLASLVKQLSQGQACLPDNVRSLYENHKEKRTRPTPDELSQILQTIASIYSKVFIIVDALDECQVVGGSQPRFLSEIFYLQANCNVNVFATSRFIPEIMEIFEGRSLTLKIRASEEDVGRYIDGRMADLPSFVRRNTDLQKEIKAQLINTIGGMFLLAQLHLDSLIGKGSLKAVRAALAKLPTGSEAYDLAYKDAMGRIEAQVADQRDLAKQVLSWITCAKRPLTILELQYALGVEIGEPELDHDNLPQVEDMVSVCAGLVTVEESGIIRLVHHTTKEYFERTKHRWFLDAETEITRICVTYLSFRVFNSGFCSTDDVLEERMRSNILYDYAVHNWGHHAREASTVCQEVLDFLKCEVKVGASSQALMAIKQYPEHSHYSQQVPRQMTGLHLAAYFGLNEAVNLLIKQIPNVDLTDSYGNTPLSWAARNGHEMVVKLLLENGANLEFRRENGQTPLLSAARYGHEKIAKLLIEKGATLELKDNNRLTPLLCAALNGHETVVRLLLENGAELESKDKGNRTALLWAAMNGQVAVVKLLLEKGADPESKDDISNETPLLLATRYGHEAVVELLEERLGSKDVGTNNQNNTHKAKSKSDNRVNACQCYKVVERYSVCGCLYFTHGDSICSAHGPHHVKERTVRVGYACPQHQPNLISFT